MNRSVTITMSPPGLLDRIWYRSIRAIPPDAVGATYRAGKIARLVPTRFRAFHRAYAAALGFFWLPCPLCGREFGGHQSGKDIPDPTDPPLYISVCPPCSREANP